MGKGKGKKGKDGKGKGKGKAKVVIEPHRHEGAFVSKGKDDSLVTKNMVPGESVYGEKRLVAETEDKEVKVEDRVWNPFRIVTLNASYFLKNDGQILISIKANCVDSTAAPEAVFAMEVENLKKDGCKPKEQLTLEPYHRDHALVLAVYRPTKKKAKKEE